MRRSCVASFVVAGACISAVASGQPSELPPPPLPPPGSEPSSPPPHEPRSAPRAPPRPTRAAPPPYEERIPPASTPLPRRGFQIAVRSGLAVPLGEAVPNRGLGETWSPQLLTWVDVGGKPIPELFIGGYLATGLGGVGDGQACSSCTAYSFRIGAQIQYHFQPANKVDPWIGYGLGWDFSGVFTSARFGRAGSLRLSGPEFAHLMGGLDFRISRVFGVGPFADFALGTYTTADGGSIPDTALHQWLIVGAKFTFFP
ncbi:MAG: hypothetical protein KF819_00210 [Labilithrix sp.]|nr:hypothetical protein [Labilithrix sp.]